MPLSGKLLVVEPKFIGETCYAFTPPQLHNLAVEICSFYRSNSRGLLTVTPFVQQVELNVDGHTVLGQTSTIKNKFPGFLFYIIVSPFVNGDHSGDSVGYVKSCLYETGNHETGHLLHLQHSDTWQQVGNNWSLIPMQDGLSCMSKDPSAFLAAPQYIFLNWIPVSEVVKVATLPATFKLQRISSFGSIEGVGTVAMVASSLTLNGKVLYISYPQGSGFFGSKPTVALHLEYGNSGSEKIKQFTNGYYDAHFSGLTVSLVANTDGTITVTVTDAKPAEPIVNELIE